MFSFCKLEPPISVRDIPSSDHLSSLMSNHSPSRPKLPSVVFPASKVAGKIGESLGINGNLNPVAMGGPKFSALDRQASSQNQLRDARKVSDESSSRDMHAVKVGSSGLVADLCCSEPPKSSPAPTYADIVRKTKESGLNSKEKKRTGNTNAKFDDRSFGEPAAFGQILEVDGRKIISFSAQEIEELAAPFKYTLVGKFSHGFPSMKTIRLIMGNINLQDEFSVSLLEEKHVLIRLCCEEDYSRLWCRQVWFMAGFPMRVLKWTPDFCPQIEAPFAPVWVTFPYLPVHLFDKRSLFIIASTLGEPLRIGSATADLSRASNPRVCIEMDVTKARLAEVELRLGGKIKMQEVEYENIPSYCSFCKHLGHDFQGCKSASTRGGMAHPNRKGSPPNPDLPPPPNSVLDDSLSLNSKGILTFTTACDNLLDKPVNVSKIRDDILLSYDLFENVSEVESVCITTNNDGHTIPDTFLEAFTDKNYYSDGDSNSDSAPIILPPKKKVQKKSKNKPDNPKHLEERVELQIINTTEKVEGFIEVVSKNKKKKGKEKINPG